MDEIYGEFQHTIKSIKTNQIDILELKYLISEFKNQLWFNN